MVSNQPATRHQGHVFCEYLIRNQAVLAKQIMDRHFQVSPEITQRYNEHDKQEALRDAQNNLFIIGQALTYESPELMIYHFQWLNNVLITRGIPTEDLTNHLEITRSFLLPEAPSETQTTIESLINETLKALEKNVLPTGSYVSSEGPLGELRTQFFEKIIAGERREACQLVYQAAAGGTSIEDIYELVFCPVQMEAGRLWEINKISVAQEHYITAVTQLAISQLYPLLFQTTACGPSIVMACTGNELHELGIRMVADLFETKGWDSHYLGANTPPDEIAQFAQQQKAQAIGLSTGMANGLPVLKQTIAIIKQMLSANIPIIVGGHLFDVIPNLWKKVGADFYARSPRQAMKLLEDYIENHDTYPSQKRV